MPDPSTTTRAYPLWASLSLRTMVVCTALTCGLGSSACNRSNDAVPTATAVLGSVTETRSFQGQLQAAEAHRLVAPMVWGLTVSWMAEEGTRVAEGDLVLSLDTKEYEKQRRDLVSRLEFVQAKIGQLETQRGLAKQAAARQVEQSELDRHLAELRTSDSLVVPLVERERARVELALAELDVADAHDGVVLADQGNTSEVELLALDTDNLTDRIAELDRNIAACQLRAPGAGMVVFATSRRGNAIAIGERVWMGQTLAELPDLSSMQVEGWVHEVDSPGVATGQFASVRMDAHPNETFPAHITTVAPLAVPRGENDVKHVQVLLDFEATDPRMKPGMTVAVELVVRAAEDAAVVPAAAVMAHQGRQVVWVDDGDWTPQLVAVLAIDDHSAAVTGVEEGDTVALARPAGSP